MLFPEFEPFAFTMLDLADRISSNPAPPINPLPCDRWIARSCLQKAIRRGQTSLAQRALANLVYHDRRATWRHLTIIALEDVGVANLDVVAGVLGARQDRKWRDLMGGDWPVLAELVRQMADSEHCQANCDLLLRALNDPTLEHVRATAIELELDATASTVADRAAPIMHRAIAALSMGGALAVGQPHFDPAGVFDLLDDGAGNKSVVQTSRTAWKVTRNPMAFMFPLVWEYWSRLDEHDVVDDPLPAVQMIDGVPGYSLDQFTRLGNAVSRALLRKDATLRQLLLTTGVMPAAQSRAVGDLLFLHEGGLLVKRATWGLGDYLRLPARPLPTAAIWGDSIADGLAHIESKASQIAQLRRQHFHPV